MLLAIAFVTLPFVVRTVQPVLEELETDVEDAAASLGATRFTTFRRVILPSLVPAIFAGAALSFARGISEYGALVLISGNLPRQTEVVSVRLFSFLEGGNTESAAAVATIMLLVALLAIVTLDIDPATGGPTWLATSTAVTNQSPVVKWVLRLLVIGYLVMLVAWPTAYVVKHTFADGLTGIQDALADPDVVHALKLTAQIAVIAVVINTVFGVGMSLLLVRHTFIGKRALSVLIDLPLSVSPVVVGLALVLVYNGRFGWFGPWLEDNGIQVIFAKPGMIMATCFVILPLVIREIVPGARGARRRPGAGGSQPRGQRSPDLLADHPARHQVGGRVRRGAQPGPRPRRVRRDQGRRRQRRRRDPGGHRARPAEISELPAGDGVLRGLHARLRGRACA